MSTTFSLVRGDREINIAHRHAGPTGPCVVYNSKLIKVNQSLDMLFLRLCEYVDNGWRITGDYNFPNGFSPIEFYNEFKKYGQDPNDLFYFHANHERPITIGCDGTFWHDLTDVC